jgi:hypothetical protein
VPVSVTQPWHVVVEKPNEGARGLGLAGIIVGGSIFVIAGLTSYAILVGCGPDGPWEGDDECDSRKDAVPYLLVATGVGAVVGGIGIGVFVNNSKPSVEVLPVVGKQARRAPETFVGLGSLRGMMLPGLELQTSF